MKMQEDKGINNIIIASFSGEVNSDELNRLKCWLQESEANQREFEIIRQFWNNSKTSFNTDNQEYVFQKLQELINQRVPVIPIQNHGSNRNLKAWLSVAAVALIIISFGFLLFRNPMAEPSQFFGKLIEKSNPAGRKSTIILPDSSLVWLNSDSRIVYYDNYGEKDRVVLLEGEAYFEVKRNNDHPFKVKTNNIITTAIGTSFNINTRNNLIKVSLITGKVRIENSEEAAHEKDVILNPGEEIVYDTNKSELVKHNVDLTEVLYWKEKTIYFKRASFNEVIETLERWYGVEFIVENQHDQDWNFTGKFHNENLENVLLAISFAKQMDFSINHEMVYLKINE